MLRTKIASKIKYNKLKQNKIVKIKNIQSSSILGLQYGLTL